MSEHGMQILVSTLFERLEQESIQFVILRGSLDLSSANVGSDVDLIVDPADCARLNEILHSVSSAHSVQVWEEFHAGHLTQYYLRSSKDARRHEFFEIDVHTAETCFGVPFMQASMFLAPDKQLAQAARLVANFLTPLLSGGEAQERYRAPLLDCLERDEHPVLEVLTKIFGSKNATSFVNELRSDRSAESAGTYRRILFLRGATRTPARTLAAVVRFFYAVRVAPLLRPRGRFVALLGTDGSGKSTLAAELATRLGPVFREGGVHQFHMRPGVLPQLHSLLTLKKTVYTAEQIANPHKSKPSGLIGSILRLLYYWSDYVLGSVLRIRPLRRRNSLVLFDRYFDDYCVDSRRARIAPGLKLPAFLAPRTPRPDVILVCTTDLKTVYARKQEHEIEESARQIAAYEALASTDPRFQIVNTGGTLSESADEAIEAIFARHAA